MAADVGKTADVGWQIGVSRTVPYPVTAVWEFLCGKEGAEIWLGPGVDLPRDRGATYETANGTTGEIRSFRELDRIRLTWRPKDWDHDSTLQVALSSSGAKTTVRFHQEWLASAEERAEQKEYWTGIIERLITALGER